MHRKQPTPSPDQSSLMDLIDAARDDAIQRVDAHADSEWKTLAYDTGMRIAACQESLMSEDIWQALSDQGVHTHEPRAMGAVMKRLHADKVIRPTDRFVKSPSPLGHGRPSRIWESLVVAGPVRTLEPHDRPSADSRTHDPYYRCGHNIDRDYYFLCPVCGANTGKEFRP